jgi:hypothetical protein
MLGIMDILVYYEHISNYVQTYWEIAKELARNYLGPSPNMTYLLFDNEEVVPAGKLTNNIHCKYAHVAEYIPSNAKIVANSQTSYKRLPWISAQYIGRDRVIDITDWMSDIKTNTTVSLLGVLRLASYALNVHLPETEEAKVLVITRDGEEEEYKYTGKTKLLKRITPTLVEMHRKDTCPYDNEGLFF